MGKDGVHSRLVQRGCPKAKVRNRCVHPETLGPADHPEESPKYYIRELEY